MRSWLVRVSLLLTAAMVVTLVQMLIVYWRLPRNSYAHHLMTAAMLFVIGWMMVRSQRRWNDSRQSSDQVSPE